MNIETERLILRPISDEELASVIDREPDPALRQAYAEMLEGCRRQPEERVWHTLWFLSLKNEHGTVVGDLSFKGRSEDGSVELGYGLRPGCCGRGYMSEAVRAVTAWALRQPGVARVEAETEPNNAASQKVLARAGFVPTGGIGEEGPRFVYLETNGGEHP